MRKTKVYVDNESLDRFQLFPDIVGLTAYTCRGVCKDSMNTQREGRKVVEINFYSQDVFNTSDHNRTVGLKAYLKDGKLEALSTRAVKLEIPGAAIFFNVWLDLTEYEPLHVSHVPAVFQRGENGRLYTRLNLHPEEDGLHAIGKIYFPDRSFTDACEGEALIEAASVKDKGSYGFVSGKMLTCDSFDMSAFLDWTYDEGFPAQTEVAFFATPKMEFAVLSRHYRLDLVLYFRNGEIRTENQPAGKTKREMYAFRESTLSELYLEDRFGEGKGNDLRVRFLPAKCMKPSYQQAFFTTIGKNIPAGCPELLACGISQGVLQAQVLVDVSSQIKDEIYAYELMNFAECVAFSDEELEEMIDQFNAANEATDEKVRALIKLGHLRIITK